LAIDVTGLNDQTWVNRFGNYHRDAPHVIERQTPAVATRSNYEATIEDPKVLSRRLKISMQLYSRLEKDA